MVRIAIGTMAAGMLTAAYGLTGAQALSSNQLALLAATAASLAAIATGLALMALLTARRAHAATERLQRAVDAALRDLKAGSVRAAGDLATLAAGLDGEIRGAVTRITALAGSGGAPAAIPAAANIVALDAHRARGAVPKLAAGDVREITLQPIVAVPAGAAAAFAAFARVALDNGEEMDVQRPAALPEGDAARFQVRLLGLAIDAAQRDGMDARTPLHVPLGSALLADAAATAEAARLLRAECTGIVQSFPLPSIRARPEAVAALLRHGGRGAAEGWPESTDELAGLPDLGIAWLEVEAELLLERRKARRSVAAQDLLETAAAAGIVVIAAGVDSDEDAVALMDLGIELMRGGRFSAPRRLRAIGIASETAAG